MGDLGLIPGSGSSPRERNGTALQYPCLENSMDRGAWWATVHGVAKSWTQVSNFTFFLSPLGETRQVPQKICLFLATACQFTIISIAISIKKKISMLLDHLRLHSSVGTTYFFSFPSQSVLNPPQWILSFHWNGSCHSIPISLDVSPYWLLLLESFFPFPTSGITP